MGSTGHSWSPERFELAECGVVREGFLEEGMCKLDLKAGKKQGENRERRCVPSRGYSMCKGPEGRGKGLYCLAETSLRVKGATRREDPKTSQTPNLVWAVGGYRNKS